MAFIDGTVVNVALPAIQSDLDASVTVAQWVVNAYMLLLSALILVGGAAGDRFGRRKIFVVGVAVFTAASLACAMAPGAGMLIAARALQGIGGALLVPNSLALISANFPEGERGKAIGTWAGFSALTTALGPVLGGWLVDASSWRLIFYVNVPIAAAAVLLARRIPESREDSGGPLDWRGALLVVAGFGAIVEGLAAATLMDWRQPAVFGSLIGGGVILAFFLRHEARTAVPMVPLDLFRSREFAGTNAITFLLYFALSGAMFFLPFNLIRIQHYSATLAGAAFLPFTLLMGTLSRWSGGLADRYGARVPLTVGPLITGAGLALLALPGIGGSYWSTFFLPMLVLGLGMAVSVAPLTTTLMAAVPEHHAGTASGINNSIARLAGSLAVAVLSAIGVGVFARSLAGRLETLQVPASVREAALRQAPRLAEAKVPGLEAVLAQSFVSSYRVAMLIAAGLAVLSAGCAWATIGRKTGRS
jgi:EmrB/QacA subfamily drug resistance transporter